MWKPIAATLALLAAILALTEMQAGHPGLDPRDQLRFERDQAARRKVLLAEGEPVAAALNCAAGRVGRQTVQTLYLVWINQRPDLVPAADRDAAGADLEAGIAGCGGDVGVLTAQAHARGRELENEAARAVLEAGR